MLLSPGSIIGAIGQGLMLNMLLKIVIAGIVAPIAMTMLLDPKPEKQRLLRSTLIIAVGGSLAFQVLMWFPGGLIGILLAIAAFWIVVSCTLDHYFEVHYDQSYGFTGQIVGISVLLWLIVGLGVHFLGGAK